MTRILSQVEIDALLASVPGTDGASGRHPGNPTGSVTAYDFRRPDRFSKDQIRSLHLLHDRFARNVTSSLSAYLRTSIEVSVSTVEQFSYSEFLMSLIEKNLSRQEVSCRMRTIPSPLTSVKSQLNRS
jgi:flagellar motor switch protein FliM